MISLNNISLVYGGPSDFKALSNINLDIKRGESWALIGPSGCGKSSLLFLISGLLVPTHGTVSIDNHQVTTPTSDVALILQDYGLFPWKTVWANVALGLKFRNYPSTFIKQKVETVLDSLGLIEFKDKYPNQLSGGQRQRVAIGRALAIDANLLLMDEPFSALDALTRENLQEMVLEIWNKQKATLVFVTHNIEEAVYLGQKIAIMTPHPGKIKSVLDNCGAGTTNYRTSPQYHHYCNKVRKILEEQ